MARLTVPAIVGAKLKQRRLVVLTAYDAPSARLAEQAGVDILLVGDSVGNTMLGRADTLEVTMDEMVHHTRAVVRGSERAHVVFDMPFMSYQGSEDDAVRNAGRALKEAGAQSVKLEGGARMAPTIARLVDIGVPVMGHVGLRPQMVNQLGGYPAQGTDARTADVVIEDAIAVAQAGAYSMVLERVPIEVTAYITAHVAIPTIGIGAGPHCDGQVLVWHDMLGLDERFHPKHSKQYASLAGTIRDAISTYAADVRDQRFPSEEHSVHASAALREYLDNRP
jgi:3-methyl-2-oxobutanoate hydroxymethyltransferase